MDSTFLEQPSPSRPREDEYGYSQEVIAPLELEVPESAARKEETLPTESATKPEEQTTKTTEITPTEPLANAPELTVPTPTATETTPAVTEQTLTTTETTPVVAETLPVVTEATPVVTETPEPTPQPIPEASLEPASAEPTPATPEPIHTSPLPSSEPTREPEPTDDSEATISSEDLTEVDVPSDQVEDGTSFSPATEDVAPTQDGKEEEALAATADTDVVVVSTPTSESDSNDFVMVDHSPEDTLVAEQPGEEIESTTPVDEDALEEVSEGTPLVAETTPAEETPLVASTGDAIEQFEPDEDTDELPDAPAPSDTTPSFDDATATALVDSTITPSTNDEETNLVDANIPPTQHTDEKDETLDENTEFTEEDIY